MHVCGADYSHYVRVKVFHICRKLIFVSVSENNQLRSVTMKTVIKIAGLDGSDLKDLVTGEVYDPHALAVDPRENR